MERTITLYDATIVTDEIYCSLSQLISAFTLMLDSLEDDLSCGVGEKASNEKRMMIDRGYKYYDTALLLLSRLNEIAKDAENGSQKFLEAEKRHKEANV